MTDPTARKVYFENPAFGHWIDLEALHNRLNDACANGTKPDLTDLQDARHIIESLLFGEILPPEVTETETTYHVNTGGK